MVELMAPPTTLWGYERAGEPPRAFICRPSQPWAFRDSPRELSGERFRKDPHPGTWRPLLRTEKKSLKSGSPRSSNPLDSVKGLLKSTGGPVGPRNHPHRPGREGAPRGPAGSRRDPSEWELQPGETPHGGGQAPEPWQTCYVNSALHCLSYTPPMARYLLLGLHSGA